MEDYKQKQVKKRLASKQKQAAAVIMHNEPLNINDIMKELIPKRLQTENLSSTSTYVLHWSRDYSCSFPNPVLKSYTLIF